MATVNTAGWLLTLVTFTCKFRRSRSSAAFILLALLCLTEGIRSLEYQTKKCIVENGEGCLEKITNSEYDARTITGNFNQNIKNKGISYLTEKSLLYKIEDEDHLTKPLPETSSTSNSHSGKEHAGIYEDLENKDSEETSHFHFKDANHDTKHMDSKQVCRVSQKNHLPSCSTSIKEQKDTFYKTFNNLTKEDLPQRNSRKFYGNCSISKMDKEKNESSLTNLFTQLESICLKFLIENCEFFSVDTLLKVKMQIDNYLQEYLRNKEAFKEAKMVDKERADTEVNDGNSEENVNAEDDKNEGDGEDGRNSAKGDGEYDGKADDGKDEKAEDDGDGKEENADGEDEGNAEDSDGEDEKNDEDGNAEDSDDKNDEDGNAEDSDDKNDEDGNAEDSDDKNDEDGNAEDSDDKNDEDGNAEDSDDEKNDEDDGNAEDSDGEEDENVGDGEDVEKKAEDGDDEEGELKTKEIIESKHGESSLTNDEMSVIQRPESLECCPNQEIHCHSPGVLESNVAEESSHNQDIDRHTMETALIEETRQMLSRLPRVRLVKTRQKADKMCQTEPKETNSWCRSSNSRAKERRERKMKAKEKRSPTNEEPSTPSSETVRNIHPALRDPAHKNCEFSVIELKIPPLTAIGDVIRFPEHNYDVLYTEEIAKTLKIRQDPLTGEWQHIINYQGIVDKSKAEENDVQKSKVEDKVVSKTSKKSKRSKKRKSKRTSPSEEKAPNVPEESLKQVEEF